MYRFLARPRWILFHLLCLGAVALMVALGFWQLDRWQTRREFNDRVGARAAAPPVAFGDLIGDGTDPDDVEWRTVTVEGEYLADEQLVEVNRAQEGRPGANVVTPLRLDDGTVLLVNRGFVPEPNLEVAEAPAPPEGDVIVEGRVRTSERRGFGGLSEPDGPLTQIQRIDLPRLAAQLPGALAPVYLDLLASDPPQGDVPTPVPPPELSEGPHISYMLQWWFFSACVVVGWVLLVRREARGVSGTDRSAGPDAPTPADGAHATAPS